MSYCLIRLELSSIVFSEAFQRCDYIICLNGALTPHPLPLFNLPAKRIFNKCLRILRDFSGFLSISASFVWNLMIPSMLCNSCEIYEIGKKWKLSTGCKYTSGGLGDRNSFRSPPPFSLSEREFETDTDDRNQIKELRHFTILINSTVVNSLNSMNNAWNEPTALGRFVVLFLHCCQLLWKWCLCYLVIDWHVLSWKQFFPF